MSSLSHNMFRVGEYVYFDSKGNHPYLIRRIEEFLKGNTGVMEVRTTVCFRRRDVSSAILRVADAAHRDYPDYLVMDENGQEVKQPVGSKIDPIPEGSQSVVKPEGNLNGSGNKDVDSLVNDNADSASEKPDEKIDVFDWGLGGLPRDAKNISSSDRFKLRQKELFLSRKEEKLCVNHIRGKVQVNLLSEIEASQDYLGKEDVYFYSLVYDPEKLSMLADKGAIRVGTQYQTEVPEWNPPADEDCREESMCIDESEENKENGDLVIDEDEAEGTDEAVTTANDNKDDSGGRGVLVYTPEHKLSNHDMDRYLIHVRAVGVFARLLDPNSASRYPSAQMLGALAAKDSTTQYAMGLLHKADYNVAKACDFLIPPADVNRFPLSIDEDLTFNTVSLGGPLLVRDTLEEFSAAESALFEEGLERMGKDFSEIRCQMMPWRTLYSIIDYYYLYKTTNRYIDGRKKKLAAEKESKLQQVYVPPMSKDEFHQLSESITPDPDNSSLCQGCQCSDAAKWFKWGSRQNNYRLCVECWSSWRKHGGLAKPHSDDRFDSENPADPDLAEQMIRHLSNTQLTKVLNREPKRFGAHAYTSYVVASPSDLHSLQGNSSKQNRTPFNMKANLFTRAVRKLLPKNILPLRKYARTPFFDITASPLKPHIASADLSRVCDAVKLVLRKSNVDSQQIQPLVTSMITQFIGSGKRPRASSPAPEEPTAKRAPALSTLPYIADDARNSPRSGQYSFFSGPKFRQRRRELIELPLARRICRRPHRFDDRVLGAPLTFLTDFVNSSSHNSTK